MVLTEKNKEDLFMRKVKLVCFVFAVALSIVFTSCSPKSPTVIQETNSQLSYFKESSNTPEFQSSKETHIQHFEQDSGGAVIETRKYRVRYYSIPAPFADLVGRDVCYEWEIEYNKTHDIYSSDRMLIVDFVKAFDISKEDFEKANLIFAKKFSEHHKIMMNPLDYTNQEVYEVFNADIIYTFDNDIINGYYLSHDYPFLYEHEYEEAVSNGTYQTRTTDWIDIEQMEAEIIAKYGEAEIVTETPIVPDEIPSTDLQKSDITE